MSERITRSLTLLRVFVVVSALVLAAAALVLGTILGRALREQAIEDAEASLTQYTNGVLGGHVVRNDQVAVGPGGTRVLKSSLETRPDILSLKVWRADSVLAWTNLAPERIGRRFPKQGHVTEVIESGQADAELEELHDAEDEAEASLGVDHVLEVYAPILDKRGRTVGAFEIYADSGRLESSIAKRKREIWLATAAVFALVALLLFLLVRGASTTLRRQTETLRARSKDLLHAYRRLEESSLEAIESLNATVEAKDPYTAGHSQRVQRIALALGEELGLGREELDALRYGGLFHDIGKLGIPDAILTKPARLTPDEYELIKRHPADGAHIVGKFRRLAKTVPIIARHHERWDGRGYPDGVRGEEIPVEAAIVGLADAWDAMTTDRPYHRALRLEEATAEVRNGRATQFAPVVVDAFFAVLRRRPSDLFSAELEAEPERLHAEAG